MSRSKESEEGTGSPRGGDTAALARLLEVTASRTGQEFFRSLVRALAELIGVSGAWVTEYDEDAGRLRARAFWLDGAYVDAYEYAVAGTPCEPVISGEVLHIPERVVDLFPDDPDLEKMSAVSYLGAPCRDRQGRVLGHLAVLDRKPLPEPAFDRTLFRVFADRAAAEMERLRGEERLRGREEKLSRLVEGARDAILEMDAAHRLTQVNPSAEELLGRKASGLLGEEIGELLDEPSREHLASLAGELASRPAGERATWIPGGLRVRGPDGTEPVEATLARYGMEGRVYLALILRSVRDRVAAETRLRSLRERAEYLEEELQALGGLAGSEAIVGRSRAILGTLRAIEKVAPTDTTVLIQGETGTGKELVARAIHAGSRRSERPLIRVNCAAIPENLMESELFGHEKGAFTGATRSREGRFSLAHGGTLFLDEVGEMPLALQAKLLRVLQEGEFEPVGSSRTRSVDVRILAATNRELEREVEAGTFREDLFYRLAVFPMKVAPLRERKEDIVPLARHLVERLAGRLGREAPDLAPEDEVRLEAYEWPGNVRELQNVLERALVIGEGGRLALDQALPFPEAAGVYEPGAVAAERVLTRVLTVEEMRRFERSNLERALEKCDWKVSGEGGAAELLGMPPSTLASRMKALGLRKPGD